ncbi:conserved hypothetical protein [Planktothrix sp. PCC 11201]|nr:conserved hypothetical protein [Planktothrix sp. PCC 11201]
MKILQEYTIVTRPDDNGTFVAYVRCNFGLSCLGKKFRSSFI